MFNIFKSISNSENNSEQKYNNTLEKAYTYLNNNKINQAISTYKEAINIFPRKTYPMISFCKSLIEKKYYKEAINIAYQAIKICQIHLDKKSISNIYYYLGLAYKELATYEKSVSFFRLSLINDPSNLNSLYNLTICYLNQKDYDNSLLSCNKIISTSLDFAQKTELFELKDFLLEKIEELHPENKHISAAKECEESQQYKLAESEYKKAIEISPDNHSLYAKLCSLKIKSKENEQAILFGNKAITFFNNQKKNEDIDSIISTYSNLIFAYNAISDFNNSEKSLLLFDYFSNIKKGDLILSDKEKFLEAESHYLTAFNKIPDRHEAIERIISFHIKQNNYETALEYITKGFQLAQKNKEKKNIIEYFKKAATCFYSAGQISKAIEFYNNILQLSDDKNDKLYSYYKKSECYEKDKNIILALNQLEKCNPLLKNGAEDQFDISSLIAKFKALLDKSSDYNKSLEYCEKGKKLFQEKKYSKASEAFKLSLSFMPESLETTYFYCKSLTQNKESKKASDLAYEGYKLAHINNDHRFTESFCYFIALSLYNDENNYKDALEFFLETITYNPENADCYYHIANCYHNLGDEKKATEYFKKAKKHHS